MKTNYLSRYSDQQLEKELQERKAERQRKIDEDRRNRRVVVICPRCNGQKYVRNYDTYRVAVGEASETLPCSFCKETGRITALRAG